MISVLTVYVVSDQFIQQNFYQTKFFSNKEIVTLNKTKDFRSQEQKDILLRIGTFFTTVVTGDKYHNLKK